MFKEIDALRLALKHAIEDGHLTYAAQVFTDFWGGIGTWQTLDQVRKQAVMAWVPKAPLDFAALLTAGENISLPASIPVTLVRGEHTHRQTAKICDILVSEQPDCHPEVIANAGHMGPFTHAEKFAEIIAGHIFRAEKAQAEWQAANFAAPEPRRAPGP